MYIHIGNKLIVSDKKIIGIFNVETLTKSEINTRLTNKLLKGEKTIIIDDKNRIIKSKVSPFTIISRTELEHLLWRKSNV